MAVEEPTKSFERLTFVRTSVTPLLFTDLIDCSIERLYDVEAVQDQLCIGAVCASMAPM